MSSRGPGFSVGSVTPSSAAFCFCFVTPLSEQVRARVQGPYSAPQAKQKRAAQGSLLFGSLVSFLNVRISRWHVCVSEAWTCQAGRPSDHLVEVTSRRDGKPKKARATVDRVEQKAARVWLPPLGPSASGCPAVSYTWCPYSPGEAGTEAILGWFAQEPCIWAWDGDQQLRTRVQARTEA